MTRLNDLALLLSDLLDQMMNPSSGSGSGTPSMQQMMQQMMQMSGQQQQLNQQIQQMLNDTQGQRLSQDQQGRLQQLRQQQDALRQQLEELLMRKTARSGLLQPHVKDPGHAREPEVTEFLFQSLRDHDLPPVSKVLWYSERGRISS